MKLYKAQGDHTYFLSQFEALVWRMDNKTEGIKVLNNDGVWCPTIHKKDYFYDREPLTLDGVSHVIDKIIKRKKDITYT